jgi:hypothetical protein
MKNIQITLIAGAALPALDFTASAQTLQNSQTVVASLPNVPASTTTNLATPVLIGTEKQQNVAIQFWPTWSATSGTATNAIYTLCPTVDGSTPDINRTWTVSANGATPLLTTNVNNGGYAGLFITAIQNTHTTGVLTNSVKYRVKIGCP